MSPTVCRTTSSLGPMNSHPLWSTTRCNVWLCLQMGSSVSDLASAVFGANTACCHRVG